MDNYNIQDYAGGIPMGGSDFVDDSYKGKRVFPTQNNRKSEVIVQDLYSEGPQSGYTGGRLRALDNDEFMRKQSMELQKISQAPTAGKIVTANPDEKNWARYDEDNGPIKQISQNERTRSFVNDDIVGSKPRNYGGMSQSKIAGEYRGQDRGLQERKMNYGAPYGSGGNLDSTSYGKKWLTKTEKEIHHSSAIDNSHVQKARMDALDQERVRLDSRNANLAGNDMGGILQQPEAFNNEYTAPAAKKSLPVEDNSSGLSYIDQKKEELRHWKMQQENGNPSQAIGGIQEDQTFNEYEKQDRKTEQMAMMNINQPKENQPPAQQMYQEPMGAYGLPGKAREAPYDISYQAPPREPAYQPKAEGRLYQPRNSELAYQSQTPSSGVDMAAGGVPQRRQSEDSKFSLAEDHGPHAPNYFQTSSMLYGKYDHQKPVKYSNEVKAHGIPVVNKDKDFNVITGEFVGAS